MACIYSDYTFITTVEFGTDEYANPTLPPVSAHKYSPAAGYDRKKPKPATLKPRNTFLTRLQYDTQLQALILD